LIDDWLNLLIDWLTGHPTDWVTEWSSEWLADTGHPWRIPNFERSLTSSLLVLVRVC